MSDKCIREFYQVEVKYIEDLYFLQTELLKLQRHVDKHKLRIAIFFEGRDTAGKGSAIARFTQFLNPRTYRTVALDKPTKTEQGQWYFQRYFKRLPDEGQLVFFDRSWYNRALVEPVMGFCTDTQHQLFMGQVNLVEKMLVDDGVTLIKFWFSIKVEDQKKRIEERINTPLIQWKVSPVDLAAQAKWEEFTAYKNAMFERTHTEHSPWLIVRGNDREDSRIQSMRYMLSMIDYDDKSAGLAAPDEQKIFKWCS
jgi:polyphosphate kinase 2